MDLLKVHSFQKEEELANKKTKEGDKQKSAQRK